MVLHSFGGVFLPRSNRKNCADVESCQLRTVLRKDLLPVRNAPRADRDGNSTRVWISISSAEGMAQRPHGHVCRKRRDFFPFAPSESPACIGEDETKRSMIEHD